MRRVGGGTGEYEGELVDVRAADIPSHLTPLWDSIEPGDYSIAQSVKELPELGMFIKVGEATCCLATFQEDRHRLSGSRSYGAFSQISKELYSEPAPPGVFFVIAGQLHNGLVAVENCGVVRAAVGNRLQ
jgi:hypothetical protein